MATQASLSFGSLTLCTPGNGDGYSGPRIKPRSADIVDAGIVGTAGRVIIITGKGSSESTALRLEFEGQKSFSSDTNLNTFLTSVQTAMETGALATVSYGIINGGNAFTKTNCSLDFKNDDPWLDGAGNYWLDFTATFTQFGV